jgi:hypothetical protein
MRKVWAIVRLTIVESLRTRVAIAFILLLAGVMVLLVTTASGDGTVAGKIQMFLSYSTGLTHFLLALLVTFLACRTLDQDIKTQRIDSLVCKPIARWQLLLGRWLGIVLLAFFLFTLSMGATYFIVRGYARTALSKSGDKFKIDNQILVARRGFMPPRPNVEEMVEKRYEQLKAQGELTENRRPSEIKRAIREQLLRQSRTVPPRYAGTWKITGLPKPQAGDVMITLRFKYEPAANTSMDTQANLRSNTIFGQWIIGRPESPKASYRWQGEKPYRSLHEINVPLNAIEPDGSLSLTFVNVDPREVAVHFPPQDGIEVLVREGSFTPNFIRTALIIFLTLLFLTTLALACGTFLSFPIASLVTLSAFFIGLAGNFLQEAIGMYNGLPFQLSNSIIENFEKVITLISLNLVPVLDISTFTSLMIDGKIVDWSDVGVQVTNLIVIKTGILAIFAAVVFHRRELGKITV